MKNKWIKIRKGQFLYNIEDKRYFINVLPFKIISLSKNISFKEGLDQAFKLNNKNEDFSLNILAPQSYFLPLIIVTNTCNLSCKYCYAWSGTYGLRGKFIDKKVIDKTLNFVKEKLKKITSRDQIEFGLILFGGEPTLAIDVLEYSLAQSLRIAKSLSKENKTKFRPIITINTNAYSFSNELVNLLKKYKSNIEVIVSYDGLWHDENRLDKKGNPTSKKVEKNIKMLLSIGIDTSLTMVVPPSEMKIFDRNIKFVTRKFGRGININPSFVRGAIPNVKDRAIYPGTLEQSYTPETVKEWGNVTKGLILEGYNIYWKRFRRRISEGGYPYRCPALLYEFCVLPKGEVYPCHNFIEKKFKLGNILSKNFIINNNKLLKMFLGRELNKLDPCKDCLFQTICLSSFDCPAHSLHDLGDFFKIDTRFCPAAQEIMDGLLQRFIKEIEKKIKKQFVI